MEPPIGPAVGTASPWWKGDPVVDAFKAHPALVLSASVLVVAVCQVLTLAGGDANLAAAVLSNVDAPTVVLGAAVSLLPVLAGGATLYAWFNAIGVLNHHGSRATYAWLAVAGVLVLALSTPAWSLVVVVAFAVIYPAWSKLRAFVTGPSRSADDGFGFRLARAHRWIALFVVTLSVAAVLARPWVSTERFTVDGTSVIGWAINSTGDDIAVLTDRPRTIRQISLNRVSDRTLCDYYRFGALDRSALAMLLQIEVPLESCLP